MTAQSSERCPCGSEPASQEPAVRKTSIERCRTCGLLVRTPMPSAQELAQWYGDGYWRRYRAEQVGSARQNLYAHALQWLGAHRSRPGVLVDVGCGGGAFLAACRAAGWQGIGFDPSVAAVAHARAAGLEAYAQPWPPCSLSDATVDAVTFMNVLDHLRDPFGAIREAWRVLRPGGLLYIRVPNGPFHVRSLALVAPLGLGSFPVFHLYGFGRASFLYHLPRLGFVGVTLRTALPSSGDPYGGSFGGKALLRTLFKAADRGCYWLLNRCGRGANAWGPSIEVLACKVPQDRVS